MSTVSAPLILYGRRQGQTKTPEKMLEEPESPVGMILPSGTDLHQVTIIPRAEWERIQDNLNHVNREAELLCKQKQEKEALYLQSKEVVKNWSNTIAGQRQKKLEARKIRDKKEEEKRREIDIEEAKYQAEKRREAIEKAKTQQYYQTDRVKGFHSALLLTEVLKERDAQVELKYKKENANKDKDERAEIQRRLEEFIYEEQLKAQNQYLKRKAITDFQLQQIKEHENAKNLEKMEEKREGEEIRQLFRLFEWEKCKLEELKQQDKCKLMLDHLENVADRDAIREVEKQKEEEDNEKIRLFAIAKQKMSQLKKEKEAEVYREMEEYRDKMSDLLSKYMKKKLLNEDNRIAAAVAEQEAKLEKELKKKEEKQRAELKAISEHRYATMKEREEMAKEEKRKILEMVKARNEADKIFMAKQKEKEQKILEENKNLQEFHIQQKAEKRSKSLMEKNVQLESAQQNDSLIALEEKQFQDYAKKVIDSAVQGGRNPFPLLKAAREGVGGGLGPTFKGNIRPNYQAQDESGAELPKYVRNSTQEVKALFESNVQQSKRRLGFTW
uniref:Cilia and flagella associated protein 210 n=1 Tax=Latimeria chalumnae TaxID=7897 RepID=M3XHX2_LATCH|nr:PREDICTED: coiled-coil domain-containing protein 173 [Latimeria chalumnae]|eukprot:XP_005997705.1 PREDICTED: coiled-coil domain-containing protein 173 [Latimeria chalumnae]